MTDIVAVLVALLRDAGARSVVDMGCGDGTIAASPVGEGFAVAGVEPSPDMLAVARRRVPEATFIEAHAEDARRIGPAFDAGYFVNSLHHVARQG
jgi:SAM-dependent methyltransferase